jgi:PsbP-like protein
MNNTTKTVAIVGVFLVVGGLWYFLNKQDHNNQISQSPNTQTTDSASWKTFTDAETGFSFRYPPQYAATAEPAPTNTKWSERRIVTIADPKDKSTYEFHIFPGSVMLEKQPLSMADGTIYHTVVEYQQSGIAAKTLQTVPDTKGELVTVNGMQALKYYLPAGDATDAAVNDYLFIKDDLVYEIGFNANNPYKDQMLRSITWIK